MNVLDLLEEGRKIKEMRKGVMEGIDLVLPNLAYKINSEGYYVAALDSAEKPYEYFLLVDFTSKQIEHIIDHHEYSLFLSERILSGKEMWC